MRMRCKHRNTRRKKMHYNWSYSTCSCSINFSTMEFPVETLFIFVKGATQNIQVATRWNWRHSSFYSFTNYFCYFNLSEESDPLEISIAETKNTLKNSTLKSTFNCISFNIDRITIKTAHFMQQFSELIFHLKLKMKYLKKIVSGTSLSWIVKI